jgi:hypothetical protein
MSNTDVPKLLPAAAMGRRLGVDPKWLCAELRAGRLPGVEAGKTALFDPEVVERLLAERARRVQRPVEASE